jgi:hypothetical protein
LGPYLKEHADEVFDVIPNTRLLFWPTVDIIFCIWSAIIVIVRPCITTQHRSFDNYPANVIFGSDTVKLAEVTDSVRKMVLAVHASSDKPLD